MKLPRIDSATYRAAVTFVQTLAGFLVALLALPEFGDLVARFYPQALPLIPTLAGIAAFVWNYARKDVPNY